MSLHPLATYPWINREELRHVFQCLYSDDIIKQEHAVDRISVWEARALSRIPVAIESTAAFARANIAYQKANRRGDADSNTLLREQYSMALIRFVNLFSERNQVAAQALPVHLVASQLGVPGWIVCLRHDATHSTLPSLAELRAAASWCLNWLKSQFWNIQCQKTVKSVDQKTSNLNDLKDALVSYMQETFGDIIEGNGVVRKNKKLLKTLEDLFLEVGSEVGTVLMEDGYFLFTQEQLESIGIGNTEVTFAGSQMSENHGIPQLIWNFWFPVISVIAKRDLLASVLLHIVSLIDEKSSFRNIFLCRWLHSILAWSTGTEKKGNKDVDIPCKTLLKMCMKIDNPRLMSSIQILIGNSTLSESQKEKLIHLQALFLNNVPYPNDENEPSLTFLEGQIRTINKDGIWKPCTDLVDWSKIPFGELPGQKLSYNSLNIIDSVCVQDDVFDFGNDNVKTNATESCVEQMDVDVHAETASLHKETINTFETYDVPTCNKLWDTGAMVKKIAVF